MKIALATATDYDKGWVDTPDLLKTFTDLGVDVSLPVWDDPTVDWSSFDVVQLHTPWDYQDKYGQFIDWCMRVETVSKLINNTATVKANSSKDYLLLLQSSGVDIPYSLIATAKHPIAIRELKAHFGGSVVIKPTIDLGGWNAKRFETVEESQPYIADLLKRHNVLIQDFVAEVIEKGECSAVMINGKLSHVVRKLAAPGEFRVQDEHGGTVEPGEIVPGLEEYCQDIINKLQQRPLYARVDYVETETTRLLMEVEMIEPELFLRFKPDAYKVFAKAVIATAQRR